MEIFIIVGFVAAMVIYYLIWHCGYWCGVGDTEQRWHAAVVRSRQVEERIKNGQQ